MTRISRRLAASAVLLLALPAASPLFGDPSEVNLIASTWATAGRPSQSIVTGHFGWPVLGFDSVAIEGEAVVVTVRVQPVNFPYAADFAFPFELPPLSAGVHPVILKTVPVDGSGPPRVQAFGTVEIGPPLSVVLERLDSGLYQVRVNGGEGPYEPGFDAAPVVEGDKITARISFECHIVCPGAPPQWETVSEPFGPLPAGVYTLELKTDDWRYPQPALISRQKIEVLDGEVLVRGGRFEIEVALDPPHQETPPRLVELPSEDSALFYFFSPDNWELMVKVLDGCALNGHYWVYGAASTDVGYTVRVTDHSGTGSIKEYRHAAGTPAPALTDGAAFPCF